LVLGASDARRCLLFIPGFMASPRAYASLLAPVAECVGRVIVPSPQASNLALLTGRYRATQQAEHVEEMACELRGEGVDVLLGGHSRGGFVALLASPRILPAGLVLFDPVSGDGGPTKKPEPLPPVQLDCTCIVIGCGLTGRCAPAGRNHEVFAAALPNAHHTVVSDCGHADVLDGPAARFGGLLCGHGRDPRKARQAVSHAMIDYLT
jgi:pimeloyl-ACP methyl ester carboxylesterase